MDDVLSACDNWYTFPSSLSWSNNCEVQRLLSDVPFIAIAILTFGVSVLFLVIKRVTLAAIWLYLSVFLAFIAAILDLSQTLTNDTRVTVISSNMRSFITAREVLLALSTGLRFLFYWSYAGEPPRKLSCATRAQDRRSNFLILESTVGFDLGGWTRCRSTGKLLMAALLVGILLVTALQIVWRVTSGLHRYNNIYATDTALELLLSVLLLLKLIVNTVTPNFPDTALRHSLGECLAPMCALLVNLALSVGNLLLFAFTESTIGRLLQAVEFYLTIVFVVVLAFDKHRRSLTVTCLSKGTAASSVNLPKPRRGSPFFVSPPILPTPRMSTILGSLSRTGPNKETLHHSAHTSLTGVSSWVSSRISRSRPSDEAEIKLWNHCDAREWQVDAPDVPGEGSRESLGPEEPKEWVELVRDAADSPTLILSSLDAKSDSIRTRDDSANSGHIFRAFRTNTLSHRPPLRLRTSGFSATPASLLFDHNANHKSAVIMTAPPEIHAQDSLTPTYGLGGIVGRPRPRSLGMNANGSGVSLDELLQQQIELDKSIAALQSFSRRSPTSETKGPQLKHLSSSTGATRRTTSDVSLSSFPAPPLLTSPISPPSPPCPPPVMRILENRRARLAAITSIAAPYGLPPPPRIAVSFPDIPSSPHSDYLSDSGRPTKFDSEGTQYDVTSFIGDLTIPGGHKKVLPEKLFQSTEIESDVSLGARINDQAADETTLRTNPDLLSPQSTFSHPRQENEISADSHVEAPRPQSNSEISKAIVSPVGLDVARADRDVLGLPARPRMKRHITSSKALPLDGRADRDVRTFERPRPPPLVLR